MNRQMNDCGQQPSLHTRRSKGRDNCVVQAPFQRRPPSFATVHKFWGVWSATGRKRGQIEQKKSTTPSRRPARHRFRKKTLPLCSDDFPGCFRCHYATLPPQRSFRMHMLLTSTPTLQSGGKEEKREKISVAHPQKRENKPADTRIRSPPAPIHVVSRDPAT
jgi:hypothetical protein